MSAMSPTRPCAGMNSVPPSERNSGYGHLHHAVQAREHALDAAALADVDERDSRVKSKRSPIAMTSDPRNWTTLSPSVRGRRNAQQLDAFAVEEVGQLQVAPKYVSVGSALGRHLRVAEARQDVLVREDGGRLAFAADSPVTLRPVNVLPASASFSLPPV